MGSTICGIRGDTTNDLLKRFDIECSARAERQDNPIILFAIGTNDSSTENGSNVVPPQNYKENLTKLFEKAKGLTDRIIFVGLFPVDETKTIPIGWRAERSYTNKSIEEYNAADKGLLQREGPGLR